MSQAQTVPNASGPEVPVIGLAPCLAGEPGLESCTRGERWIEAPAPESHFLHEKKSC